MTRIKRQLTIENFVHVLLVSFAIASIGTISDFFFANKHNEMTSWGLAVALGGGLVAISIMLARTSMDDKITFRGMLIAVIVVGIMSATIQTMAYHSHNGSWIVATVLGVGFPMIECVLAFGVALHDAAEKRKQVLHVRDNIQQRISESVGVAMSDIDVSQVRAHIEQRVDAIIRQQVDTVVDSMGLMQPQHTHASEQDTHTDVDVQSRTHSVHNARTEAAQLPMQNDAQLDDTDYAIIDAVRNGNHTPYAISKVVNVSATTLKRRKGDTHIGRIPNLVAAGVLHNSSGKDGNEYRLVE